MRAARVAAPIGLVVELKSGGTPVASRYADVGADFGTLHSARAWWCHRASVVAALAACAAMLVGCESAVVGHASKAPGSEDLSRVNAALLNTGPYEIHAGHPFGTAGSAARGAYLDAVRMAGFVVGPWEVDPALRGQVTVNTAPIADAKGLHNDVGDDVGAIAAAHGFIGGFSTARNWQGSGVGKWLVNLVMRFPDTGSAAVAATEMGDKVLEAGNPAHRRVIVPRHPDAAGSVFDPVDGGGVGMWSFTAHGPYVLWQEARTSDDGEAAGRLIADTLDLQAPRIDGFEATDPAKLADLPIDPTGQLLARTLPPPPGDQALPTAGVYQPRAELHFEFDPADAVALFDSARVEVVAQRWATRVYQTHDAAGAARVVERFMADTDAAAKPTDGVPGLNEAKCFDQGADAVSARFACLASVDRYAFIALAGQEQDAKQKTAAQYRVLAGK